MITGNTNFITGSSRSPITWNISSASSYSFINSTSVAYTGSLSFGNGTATIPDLNQFSPSIFPSMREWILNYANGMENEVRKFCLSVLVKEKLVLGTSSDAKQFIIAKKGTYTSPIIVSCNNSSVFDWVMESPKQVKEDWKAVVSRNVYRLPTKHKFLNYGITPDNFAFYMFDKPVLRPFSSSPSDHFFSWYVGFIVDINKIAPL